MTTNLTDPANQLTDDGLSLLISKLNKALSECINHGFTDSAEEYADMIKALRELQEHRKAAEPVGGDELDHLIWGIERYGLYPRQLAALKELRELRKAKGEPVVQVLSSRAGNDTSTIDKALPEGTALYAAPSTPEGGVEPE